MGGFIPTSILCSVVHWPRLDTRLDGPLVCSKMSVLMFLHFPVQSMVGSDTAELLMQDCKRLEKYKRQDPVANLINLTNEEWPVQGSGTPDLLTGEIPPSMETPEQRVEKFTKLLFYGRKKVSRVHAHLCLKRVPTASFLTFSLPAVERVGFPGP